MKYQIIGADEASPTTVCANIRLSFVDQSMTVEQGESGKAFPTVCAHMRLNRRMGLTVTLQMVGRCKVLTAVWTHKQSVSCVGHKTVLQAFVSGKASLSAVSVGHTMALQAMASGKAFATDSAHMRFFSFVGLLVLYQ